MPKCRSSGLGTAMLQSPVDDVVSTSDEDSSPLSVWKTLRKDFLDCCDNGREGTSDISSRISVEGLVGYWRQRMVVGAAAPTLPQSPATPSSSSTSSGSGNACFNCRETADQEVGFIASTGRVGGRRRHWKQRHPKMREVDKQAFTLRMVQLVKEMDLSEDGLVCYEEWMHYHLLARSGVPALEAASQINSVLKGALRKRPKLLSELQGTFQSADRSGLGSLSLDDIRCMYRSGAWRWDPIAGRAREQGETMSDSESKESASTEGRDLPQELMEAMSLQDGDRLSYGEFIAYCIGRRKSAVTINFYDLSNGLASAISPWLLGQSLEGLWHTGVVAFGKEYYYGGEIFFDDIADTPFGLPTKSVFVGYTLRTQAELHTHIVDKLKPLFTRSEYDVISRNCNHFSDAAISWLTGRHVESEVVQQPERIMEIPAMQLLRPVLNKWLGNIENPHELRTSGEGPKHSVDVERAAVATPGTAVCVFNSSRADPLVVGTVCDGCATSISGRSDLVWVRFLDLSCQHAILRTECFPQNRLLSANLVGFERTYLAALEAVSEICENPESDDDEDPSLLPSWPAQRTPGRGASNGLTPTVMCRPGSMLTSPPASAPPSPRTRSLAEEEGPSLRGPPPPPAVPSSWTPRLVDVAGKATTAAASSLAAHGKERQQQQQRWHPRRGRTSTRYVIHGEGEDEDEDNARVDNRDGGGEDERVIFAPLPSEAAEGLLAGQRLPCCGPSYCQLLQEEWLQEPRLIREHDDDEVFCWGSEEPVRPVWSCDCHGGNKTPTAGNSSNGKHNSRLNYSSFPTSSVERDRRRHRVSRTRRGGCCAGCAETSEEEEEDGEEAMLAGARGLRQLFAGLSCGPEADKRLTQRQQRPGITTSLGNEEVPPQASADNKEMRKDLLSQTDLAVDEKIEGGGVTARTTGPVKMQQQQQQQQEEDSTRECAQDARLHQSSSCSAVAVSVSKSWTLNSTLGGAAVAASSSELSATSFASSTSTSPSTMSASATGLACHHHAAAGNYTKVDCIDRCAPLAARPVVAL